MQTVKKDKYIFVEANENHNKVWFIEEIQLDSGSYIIKTSWGRVGNTLASSEKTFYSDYSADKEYNKLIRSKTKKGYTQLRTLDTETISTESIQKQTLEEIALKEIVYDKTNQTIIDLIKMFCQENIHNITMNTNITFNQDNNLFQTPCGVVTLEAINDARETLNKIYDCVKNNKLGEDFIHYTEQYCSIIPQKVTGKLNCLKIFPNTTAVENQNSVLDSLKDSIETINEIQKHSLENTDIPNLFHCNITAITDTNIIKSLKKLFVSTHSDQHACRNLKLKNIYEVSIENMNTAYNQTKETWSKNNKDCTEIQLWHGTKKQNIISILKNGIIIPPASASYCTGRMFGSDGIYLSDQSTKSLNYAYGWWSGTRDNHCFMFLCNVLMGNSYTPSGWQSCDKIPKGYDSIFAKAGYSNVRNNEMIVPVKQVCPKYLIEFVE